MNQNLYFLLTTTELQNCESLLGSPSIEGTPAFYLSLIFSVMKYAAIILLIVLSSMDFLSAVASQDNDILKKTFNRTVKRFVICIIIFFVPTILNFSLDLINQSTIDNCINTNM